MDATTRLQVMGPAADDVTVRAWENEGAPDVFFCSIDFGGLLGHGVVVNGDREQMMNVADALTDLAQQIRERIRECRRVSTAS